MRIALSPKLAGAIPGYDKVDQNRPPGVYDLTIVHQDEDSSWYDSYYRRLRPVYVRDVDAALVLLKTLGEEPNDSRPDSSKFH